MPACTLFLTSPACGFILLYNYIYNINLNIGSVEVC
jgi:hypothetical protein